MKYKCISCDMACKISLDVENAALPIKCIYNGEAEWIEEDEDN